VNATRPSGDVRPEMSRRPRGVAYEVRGYKQAGQTDGAGRRASQNRPNMGRCGISTDPSLNKHQCWVNYIVLEKMLTVGNHDYTTFTNV